MGEAIVLGAIQGVAEWLPISSKSLVILAEFRFFGVQTLDAALRYALFLHIGTFFAALFYLRRDVISLMRGFFSYSKTDDTTRRLIRFYAVTTCISGLLGLAFFKLIVTAEDAFNITGAIATLGIGILLLATGALQIYRKTGGLRKESDVSLKDGIIAGIAQGLAAIPGFSRSGFTVSALLSRKFDDIASLRMSFLMSLPAVLGGNIILNLSYIKAFSFEMAVGIFSAFVFGLLTMHILLDIARRVQFGWFVVVFGTLMIIAAFV